MSRIRIAIIDTDGTATAAALLADLFHASPIVARPTGPPASVGESREDAGTPATSAASESGPRLVRTKATRTAQVTSPARSSGKRVEEIRRRIRAGESNQAIAAAVGVSGAAVGLHRKKLRAAGEAVPDANSVGRSRRKRGSPAAKGTAKEAPDRPTYRCQNCGQRGYDPKRCDHCQEKRAA